MNDLGSLMCHKEGKGYPSFYLVDTVLIKFKS